MKVSERCMLSSSALFLFLCIWVVQPCLGVSLRVVEQRPLGKYHGVKRALRAGGDTAMFLSNGGLYVQAYANQEWQKLIDCFPQVERVPFSVCDGEQLTRLVIPLGLWQFCGAGGSEIMVSDGFCGRLYGLRHSSDGASYLAIRDQRKGDDVFSEIEVQGGTILCVLYGNDSEKKIVIQRINSGDYRKVFRCSNDLVRLRDSVGLGHTSLCLPAINPHDSTLWLAVEGYPYIYVTGLGGELRDSVPISNADYHRPRPPKSRMKSDAVYAEWSSHWTPITSFSYASPCYFIMQYETGRETCKEGEMDRSTTVVWDAKRQVVPLTIDPLWHLAGVQSDGRIIFVTYSPDANGCTETLVVTRIEP